MKLFRLSVCACLLMTIGLADTSIHAQINLPLLRVPNGIEMDANSGYLLNPGAQFDVGNAFDADDMDAIAWLQSTLIDGLHMAEAVPCKHRARCGTAIGATDFVPYVQAESWIMLGTTDGDPNGIVESNANGGGGANAVADFIVQNNTNHPGHAPNGTLHGLLTIDSLVMEQLPSAGLVGASQTVTVGNSFLTANYIGGGLFNIQGMVMIGGMPQFVFIVAAGFTIEVDEPISVGQIVFLDALANANSVNVAPDGGSAVVSHIMLPRAAAWVTVP